MQKSNRASIIVAIIAVLLILGGVFLLNQTFSNRNKNKEEDTATVVSSSSSSSTSSSRSNSGSSSSTSSSSSSSSSDKSDDITESSSTSTSSNRSNSSSTSSSGSSTSTTLNDGEVVLKVLSVTGNEYQVETLDSKGITSKYFAKGAKTRFQLNGVSLSANKTYRVKLVVRDSGSGYSIDLFQPLGEI